MRELECLWDEQGGLRGEVTVRKSVFCAGASDSRFRMLEMETLGASSEGGVLQSSDVSVRHSFRHLHRLSF